MKPPYEIWRFSEVEGYPQSSKENGPLQCIPRSMKIVYFGVTLLFPACVSFDHVFLSLLGGSPQWVSALQHVITISYNPTCKWTKPILILWKIPGLWPTCTFKMVPPQVSLLVHKPHELVRHIYHTSMFALQVVLFNQNCLSCLIL